MSDFFLWRFTNPFEIVLYLPDQSLFPEQPA